MASLNLLFKEYVAGTISDDDYHKLLSLINDPVYRDEIINLIQDEFLSYQEREDQSSFENIDYILKEIFEKATIVQKERDNQLNARGYKRRVLLKISVAAIIIIILGIGVISNWRDSRIKKEFAAVINKEENVPIAAISPATDGAVLTLANGKQILLDSSKTGVIAQQGTAKIVNAAGKLDLLNNDEGKSAVIYNNTLSTHRANVYQITLSDGTKVWLNAVSSITFPNVFVHNERRISITGEAYFEVSKNPLKPFIVNINGISIKVLGTHFNVDAYSLTKVSTTLLEGSVQISSGQNNILIKPGEAAEVTSDDISVKKVNLDKAIAWKNYEFYFEKDPLTTIMGELGRWYDVDIKYEGKIPDKWTRYSGSISRNAKLSDALLMLHKISKADFDVHDRTIVVKL